MKPSNKVASMCSTDLAERSNWFSPRRGAGRYLKHMSAHANRVIAKKEIKEVLSAV